MRRRSKYDGFSVLWVALAIAVALAAGCVGWLVYQRNSAPAATKTNTHQTQPQLMPPTKPTHEFVISEFNVKMTLPAGLTASDMSYVIDRSVSGAVFAKFTTRSLLAVDSGCTAAEGAIGIIARTTDNPRHPAERKVGDYYYAFYSPQSPCSANVNAATFEQTQVAALKQAFAAIAADN